MSAKNEGKLEKHRFMREWNHEAAQQFAGHILDRHELPVRVVVLDSALRLQNQFGEVISSKRMTHWNEPFVVGGDLDRNLGTRNLSARLLGAYSDDVIAITSEASVPMRWKTLVTLLSRIAMAPRSNIRAGHIAMGYQSMLGTLVKMITRGQLR